VRHDVVPQAYLAAPAFRARGGFCTAAPNLTPDRATGLGDWSFADFWRALHSGIGRDGGLLYPAFPYTSYTRLSRGDARAIFAYLQSLPPVQAMASDDKTLGGQGDKIHAERCAGCHGKDGRGVDGIYPPLDGSSSVIEPTGINAIRMVLLGGFSPVTMADPRPYSMPPFAQQLGDADVAAVVSYIRQAWSNRASAVLARDIGKYRHTPND
jgi:mono/diheme cytochrome c family protein